MTTKDFNLRKEKTYQKALECFKKYKKFAIVSMDNIISTQLKDLKKSWGSDAEFLIGKNSSVKRALKDLNKEELSSVFEKIKGNISIIFFEKDIRKIKKCVDDNERESVAKIGDVSQSDVWIKGHVTSMTADKTGYFQTLGIPTKITKGKIEIMQDFKVLAPGDKVGPSQANLLSLLNITPFKYKMKILSIFEDGSFYDPSLIEIEESDIKERLQATIRDVAVFSLGMDMITEASVPYEICGSFYEVLKVSYGIDYMISESPFITA